MRRNWVEACVVWSLWYLATNLATYWVKAIVSATPCCVALITAAVSLWLREGISETSELMEILWWPFVNSTHQFCHLPSPFSELKILAPIGLYEK